MTPEILQSLLKTHKIRSAGQRYEITINKPEDFVYDVSDIILTYNTQDKTYSINCAELPNAIVGNMLKFSQLAPEEFVHFIEENLSVFCMGKLPDITANSPQPQSCAGLRPGELPKDYKYPFNNAVTPNLICNADNKNVSIFTCRRVCATVACSRCKSILSLEDTEACPKCSVLIEITFIPVLSPQHLGFFALKRCSLISFNPIQYQFSCSRCNTNYETPKVGINESYRFKCYECFADILIRVRCIDFAQKREFSLKVGAELPEKGTCKHYKKSYRWFRFSCCNSLYPWDECHDESTGHHAEEAKRMVCGLCSKEQSVKKECDCGMSLKNVHKQFWEGGKGNREKATMSKKDSKKYRK